MGLKFEKSQNRIQLTAHELKKMGIMSINILNKMSKNGHLDIPDVKFLKLKARDVKMSILRDFFSYLLTFSPCFSAHELSIEPYFAFLWRCFEF